MIWEVFRQEDPGDSHEHVGNVHAPDRELASQFAEVLHARRVQTNSLWVVPQAEVTEVDAAEAHFGGTTDKSYRWAMAYNDVDTSVSEGVEESEREQREVARKRRQAVEGGDQ
ncbi:1,2-phenylacetyl-CoA epoxidase subunit PaaB [Halobacteriales archaeon Cl-PHB]